MTFERTVTGQSNRAKFYGVDWVIYTEGEGHSNGMVRSYDAHFWTAVFKSVFRDKKFKALPRGGKPQLLERARRVAGGEIDNVIVVMDRDYDDIRGERVCHSKVIYTLGYSFENDIFDEIVLFDIIDAALVEQLDEDDCRRIIREKVDKFIGQIRWAIRSDVYAVTNGVRALCRESPQKYFVSNAYGAEPHVCRDRLNADVVRMNAAAKPGLTAGLNIPKVNRLLVNGHLWETFAFRLITFLANANGVRNKVKKDEIRLHAITLFQLRLMNNVADDVTARRYRSAVESALI